MPPPRPLPRSAARAATLLSLAGLVLAGGVLGSCGRQRQAARFRPKDFSAEIAKLVGLSEPEPEPVASSAPVALATPPPTLWPAASPAPFRTAFPTAPTEQDRVRDHAAETMREYDRLQRERERREAAVVASGPPSAPAPTSPQAYSTPLPHISDVPNFLR